MFSPRFGVTLFYGTLSVLGRIRIQQGLLLIGLPDPDPYFRIKDPDPKEILVDPQNLKLTSFLQFLICTVHYLIGRIRNDLESRIQIRINHPRFTTEPFAHYKP